MIDHKEKMEKNAVDFLFYTYFGKIKSEFSSDEKIIEAAIERAYQDATMQRAYNALIPKPNKKHDNFDKEKQMREHSQKAHDDAVKMLKKGVEDLLNPETDFDEIHERICGDLVCIYKNYQIFQKDGVSLCFTPGNAQKWVNMIMKNLYVICGMLLLSGVNDVIENFCYKVLYKAESFHIPVDSYILEAWKDIPSEESSYIKINNDHTVYIKYKKVGDNYTLSESEGKGISTTAWSSIEDYKIYQEIREKCAKKALEENGIEDEWPIEWESENWIKASELRKHLGEDKK